MSESAHRRSADLLADEWSRNDEGRDRLFNAYWMTRDADLDEEVRVRVDVCGQPYHGWTMGQLATLYCLILLITNRHVVVAQFDVGAMPFKDGNREGNQQLLSNLSEIAARVHPTQRGADYDGSVRWSSIRAFFDGRADESKIDISKPNWAPLEIGHVDASTVLLHLGVNGAVARWPYGSRFLTILIVQPMSEIFHWRWQEGPAFGSDPIYGQIGEFFNRLAFGRLLGSKTARMLEWQHRERFVDPTDVYDLDE